MSGISSGVGLISGINTQQLIEQLIAAESKPKLLAQQRLQQLQITQTAVLDINSRMQTLKEAAAAFRTNKSFQLTSATSSNEAVLTATSDTTAPIGSYQFAVDRLVTTQQLLSKGFASKDTGALGATSFTFESAKARLDRDMSLSELNGGEGVSRGKITITDSQSKTATIDLSKVSTVGEVLDAINNNGTAQVTASLKDGKIVVKDKAGGQFSIANTVASSTATDLGIAGTSNASGVLTGSSIYYLGADTTLTALNDGNGVNVNKQVGEGAFDFTITYGTTVAKVNLGDVWETVDGKLTKTSGAATSVGGALQRINKALSDAGLSTLSAGVSADGTRFEIKDSSSSGTAIAVAENAGTTATDLGIVGTSTSGTLSGKRVLAGLNSTLAKSLNGGAGFTGDGVLQITARDGHAFNVTLSKDASLDEIMSAVETASGVGTNGKARISLKLNSVGTGLCLVDNTGATTSNLVVTGTSGADTATALGLSTGGAGKAATQVDGSNLQHQYVSRTTLVTELAGGKGIGTGTFRITDSTGASANVAIDSDTSTVGDVIEEINSRGLRVQARINSTGDGIELYEGSSGTAGAGKIKVEDTSGTVARALNLAGEAKGTGADNVINGSYEEKVSVDSTATLKGVMDKINAAGVGVTAAIIKDGSGSTPYRLSLVSQATGRAGRFIVDTGTFDLGASTLDSGEDARIFYGSSDPAKAVLLTASSNTLDNVISGVKINLKSTSTDVTTLTVTRDTDTLDESVKEFVNAFNDLVDRIDGYSSYDQATQRKGALLGDSTALGMRDALYSTLQGLPIGATGRFTRLADVGITVGTGGKLNLDSARLREALNEDAASVESLFVARVQADDSVIDLGNGITVKNPDAGKSFSSLGVVGRMEELAKKYLDSVDGVLTVKSKSLENQISGQKSRITDFNAKLESRRQILQTQFANMESAIAKLQQQQASLGQLG